MTEEGRDRDPKPDLSPVAQTSSEYVYRGPEDRLDRVVVALTGLPRRQARLAVAAGRIRVNNKALRIVSRTVRPGSRVQILPPPEKEVPNPDPLSVVFEDRWVAVVSKPPGLLSEADPQRGPSVPTVLAPLIGVRDPSRLWLVHRLDAPTSGVMVVARSKSVAAQLGGAFRQGQVHKEYLALVDGRFERAQTIDAPLTRIQGTRHGLRADGKPATTRLEPVAFDGGRSLVRAFPRTGRTHQIRVHLAHAGYPIVGDRLYGGSGYTDDRLPIAIPRAMLHARMLRFPHPKHGDATYRAPLARDFSWLLEHFGISAVEE